MNKKKKIDDILKRSHLVVNAATGRAEARRESRKILAELKELDIRIYNIVKEEFNG
jgi:hypothetical protein